MKLYLIRHGETDWNVVRRLQGATDIPLNEKGVMLARETAKALADVHFDRVYTSPLGRARQTAELIAAGRDIPIFVEERLREISFGPYEGLCCAPEHYNIPDPAFTNFFDDPAHYVPPAGGESLDELCARTADFVQELCADEALQEQTILLSSHGAAVKALLQGVKHSDRSVFWTDGGLHRNCAVSILECKNGQIRVLQENVIYYDPALSKTPVIGYCSEPCEFMK